MSFPEQQYKVILLVPGGAEETYTYKREPAALSVKVGEIIDVGGGRNVVVTEILDEAKPGKRIGTLRAKLPGGMS
jgi:hypothetical protein